MLGPKLCHRRRLVGNLLAQIGNQVHTTKGAEGQHEHIADIALVAALAHLALPQLGVHLVDDIWKSKK